VPHERPKVSTHTWALFIRMRQRFGTIRAECNEARCFPRVRAKQSTERAQKGERGWLAVRDEFRN